MYSWMDALDNMAMADLNISHDGMRGNYFIGSREFFFMKISKDYNFEIFENRLIL